MKQIPFNKANYQYIVKTYGNNPAEFAKDICGFNKLDEWQKWYLNETLTYGKGGKKIAISSCHSSGKTLLSSVVAIHRLIVYPESQIRITSATYSQLKQAFTGTLNKVIRNSSIKDWFDITIETIKLKGQEDNWINLQAWSIQRPEAFAGLHPESPCLIADEASGIDNVIFKSFAGSMMHSNALLILLGNPLYRRGALFDAFHKKKDFFKSVYVSALDSSFISQDWIEEMKAEYGEDSDEYRIRVLGQFPKSDMLGFISESTIRGAIGRQVIPILTEPTIAGLDVGRLRDASVLVIRKGRKVLHIEKWRTRDTMIVAEDVAKLIVKYNIEMVAVDANGVGAGVSDRLRQLAPNKIQDINLSGLPNTEKEYFNGRSKCWGLAKKWLQYGSIPFDQDLIDGGSALLYSYDRLGRYQLESKELAAKRGVSSPDTFDAFAYTFTINSLITTTVIENNSLDFSLF